MAIKYINIIFRSSFHDPTTAGWNEVLYSTSGTVALNYSDGSAAPFSLNITAVNLSNLNNSSYAAGAKHGIPQDIIKATGPYVGGTARTLNIVRDSGALTIQKISVWGASAVNDATRQTRWTIGGVTLDHDDRNYGDAAPTEFSSSGFGFPIAVSVVKVPAATFGYPDVMIFEVDDSAFSIASVGTQTVGGGGTATVSGFSSPITSGTLGGKTLTITDGVLNDIAFTVPDYVDSVTHFSPGTAQTLVLSDGTNSATYPSAATTVGASRSIVTLSSPVVNNNKYLGYHLDVTPVNGDKLVYTTADVSLSADTRIVADNPITTTVIHWVLATTTSYVYQITVNELGVVSIGPISRALSISALSRATLVVRGLTKT